MLDRRIMVITHRPETLEGVQAHLRAVGACVSSTRELGRLSDQATGAEAVLFFADEFPREEAATAFRSLRQNLPALPLVVVTDSLDPPTERARSNGIVVVLPCPARGWTLVEALREGALGPVPSER